MESELREILERHIINKFDDVDMHTFLNAMREAYQLGYNDGYQEAQDLHE